MDRLEAPSGNVWGGLFGQHFEWPLSALKVTYVFTHVSQLYMDQSLGDSMNWFKGTFARNPCFDHQNYGFSL